MAKKEDLDVEVGDDGTVTIDISDDPSLAKAKEDDEEGEPEKKPLPRVRLSDQQRIHTPAVDEATQALTTAKALAEDETKKRQAAEATANAERARREAAERSAHQHAQDADDARASAAQTQLTLLDQGIESAKNEVASYETQVADAYEKGDFKLVASLNTKLSMAAAKADRLEASKADVATRKPATTEGRVEAPVQASAFEQYVSQFAPEAQTWLRAHPECVPAQVGGNNTSNSKMMAGHYDALSKNIPPNTSEYFRVIEEHTGYRQPTSGAANVKEAGSDDEVVQQPPAKRPAPKPSAPPSREPASSRGLSQSQRTVTLSADEQEMARMSFPHLKPQEAYASYARNKIELEAEGKLGRTTH